MLLICVPCSDCMKKLLEQTCTTRRSIESGMMGDTDGEVGGQNKVLKICINVLKGRERTGANIRSAYAPGSRQPVKPLKSKSGRTHCILPDFIN